MYFFQDFGENGNRSLTQSEVSAFKLGHPTAHKM